MSVTFQGFSVGVQASSTQKTTLQSALQSVTVLTKIFSDNFLVGFLPKSSKFSFPLQFMQD